MTIYTVAERAGVSIATVSRVLQGSVPASPATRERVLRAVEELDYVPLRAARRLDLTRHETHGLVLPGLGGPHYSELLVGFESAAAQYGQSVVVLLGTGPIGLDSSLRKVLPRIDGVVLANDTIADDAVRGISRSTPTVLVARRPLPGCSTVLVENLQGAAQVTGHLLEHGRDRLLFIGDPGISHDIAERYRGFRQTLRAHRLTEAAPPVPVRYEERAAPAVVRAVLDAAHRIDALVCANDELALATMADLGRAGVRVPADIAVVGFDDLMTSRYVVPGLTTVRQPTRALGRWAAIRLHERIEGRGSDPHTQVLPTELVLRGSCGCSWPGPDGTPEARPAAADT